VEKVTVRVPAVLAQIVGGESRFEVRGETVGEALNDLIRQRPALAVHLFDGAGSLRRHILCFLNDGYARGGEALERPVRPGDTVTILNSVSGG
jgi:molybdopterin converting factor small subunit